MKRAFACVAALGFALAGSSGAQTSAPCSVPGDIPTDTLRSIALRLHPDVAASAHRNSFIVVTLIFDSNCRLIHHSVGNRRGPAILRTMSPEVARYRVWGGGYAELLPPSPEEEAALARNRAPLDNGRPHVSWAFTETANR
jgi:hypothetical protein